MEEKLLHYFTEELSYIRNGMQRFADRYPHVASQLHIGSDTMEDPYIAYLVEAFALINSRIRNHQDMNFDQLSIDLMESLYPHFFSPLPSMSVVHFQPSSKLTKMRVIKRQQTLETLPNLGEPLTFSTCYTTAIIPVTIDNVQTHLFASEYAPTVLGNARAHITLQASCLGKNVTWQQLAPTKLRFFINESMTSALQLYEQFMTHCLGLTVLDTETEQAIIQLDHSCIKPVGFADDEAMLPRFSHSSPTWHLLTEYFTFKEKFLFFDVVIPEKAWEYIGKSISLQWHFSQPLAKTLHYLNRESLQLNCSPVINLFNKQLEPLTINGKKYDYPVEIDKRQPNFYEIYALESVVDITNPNRAKPLQRLYGPKHTQNETCLWHAKRRYKTTETQFISNLTLALSETDEISSERQLALRGLCFNGNRAHNLTLDQAQQHLQIPLPPVELTRIQFLRQPTRVYQRFLEGSQYQRLIGQLSLNYLSLTDEQQTLSYIKSSLAACNLTESKENHLLIDSIVAIATAQIMERTGTSKLTPFGYGTKLTITLDNNKFFGHSRYLFCQLLERSFFLQRPINSFLHWEYRDQQSE